MSHGRCRRRRSSLFFPVLWRAPFSNGGAKKGRLFPGVSDIFPGRFSLFLFFLIQAAGRWRPLRQDENGSGKKGSEGSEAGRGGAGIGQVVDSEVCETAAEGGNGNEDLDTGFDGSGGRWVVGPDIMRVDGAIDEH